MDTHTPEQRSRNMSKIRSQDTRPEVLFRKSLWTHGIRGYRLNSNVRGKPDLYFSKIKMAIFIDGCFWHKCPRCFIRPKSNNEYWDKKIRRNVLRDSEINRMLQNEGKNVIRIWEHEIKKDVEETVRRVIIVYEKISKNN